MPSSVLRNLSPCLIPGDSHSDDFVRQVHEIRPGDFRLLHYGRLFGNQLMAAAKKLW
ncbi:MAG: hypothetical protein R3C59_29185 [Planctomycetaceae bacterium]